MLMIVSSIIFFILAYISYHKTFKSDSGPCETFFFRLFFVVSVYLLFYVLQKHESHVTLLWLWGFVDILLKPASMVFMLSCSRNVYSFWVYCVTILSTRECFFFLWNTYFYLISDYTNEFIMNLFVLSLLCNWIKFKSSNNWLLYCLILFKELCYRIHKQWWD